MASAGMAGFAQGLANSPLGNLPGLFQARESMKMEREKFETWKQDRLDQKQQQEERRSALADAGTIAETEGLGAAADFLIGAGYVNEAQGLAGINQNRNRTGIAERQQDYAELSGDRAYGLQERQQNYAETMGNRQQDYREMSGDRQYGLAERQQDFAELSGDREYGLAERQQEMSEIHGMQDYNIKETQLAEIRDQYQAGKQVEAKAGVGQFYRQWSPQMGSPEYSGFVDDLFRNESDMMNKELRLGKDRLVIGAEVVTDPDGNQFVAPKILNKKTGTVGPMTQKASSDPSDSVLKMPVRQFDQMMKTMGTQPAEAGEQKWKMEDQGGVKVMVEENTGQIRELSEDAPARRLQNRAQTVIDRMFRQPANVFDPDMQDKKVGVSAVVSTMYAKGFDADPEAAVPMVERYMQDERVQDLLRSKTKEDTDRAAVMVMNWIAGNEKPQPETEAPKGLAQMKPKAADPRSKMPIDPNKDQGLTRSLSGNWEQLY